jgi:hypothetical protein
LTSQQMEVVCWRCNVHHASASSTRENSVTKKKFKDVRVLLVESEIATNGKPSSKRQRKQKRPEN